MKPIKLEIEGLNSFSEKQVIDFSAVLREGIFGIFGNTGSGKSTILDAIVIALYGRTQKGNTKQNFVNCNSKKAVVDFTFEILYEGRRRIFEFYREFFATERNGKVNVYEIEGDKKYMRAEKKETADELVEEIVGLGFEDFKKCICLPQGEFDKFTKSKKSERLDLMARLFSLEKYGQKLYDAASKRFYAYEREKTAAEAELGAYAEYTEDSINALIENSKAASDRLKTLLTELEVAEKEAGEIVKLREAEKELSEINAALKTAEERLKDIEDKRLRLEKTDFAERAYEIDSDTAAARRKLDTLLREIFSAEEELKKEELIKSELPADYGKIYEEKKTALIKKLADLENISGSFDEMKKAEAEISEKRKEYREIETKLRAAENEKARNEERLKLNAALLSETETGDFLGQLVSDIKNGAVRDEYAYLKTENQKNGNVGWLADIIEKKLTDSEISSAPDEDGIIAAVEEEKRRGKKQKEIKDAETALHKALAECEKDISVYSEKLAAVKADGEKLGERINAERAKTESVTGGKPYLTALQDVKNAIKNLDDDKKRHEEKIEKNADNIHRLKLLIAEKKSGADNLKNKIAENALKTNEILNNCGIIDKTILLGLRLAPAEKAAANEEIKKFDENYAVLKARRAEKERLFEGRIYDAVSAKEKEERLKALRENCDELKKERAVIENSLKIAAEKLEVKKGILKNLAAVTEKHDLAKRLQQMFKGRAFLEYVADEYLLEITESASVTLMKLTSGRYALKYNQEFLVKDNINGGAERSVQTLSGGETFLVSLSLAFALSSAICVKSDRPIEFFFLDEGFGTLDDELVDVVIDSLEKFRNSHFSIGIISHVKELKERINSRINVKGATENGGSTIEITY